VTHDRKALQRSSLAVLATLCVASCARPRPAEWRSPTSEEWERARATLARVRGAAPRDPYLTEIRMTLHEPRSGRNYDGHGSVAVSPGRAVRMIAIGPMGVVLLDVWASRDAWRVAVPPLGRVSRGGRASDENIPIGFFRWWFLSPLEGQLLAASPAWDVILLRTPDAMVELSLTGLDGDEPLRATRSSGGREEHVTWFGAGLVPREGDRAAYVDDATGLRVDVSIVEGAHPMDPTASICAFVDPDGPPCGDGP
jgi:hypothetical protein